MSLPDSSILTNIQVPGYTRPVEILFEKKYITIRSLEDRLYTDEEVMKLPDIALGHTHYKEWQVRRRSVRRLLSYLLAKKRGLDILDVGCGNGWLSHLMAEIPGARVTGLDINFTELQQAARVFNDDPNLRFIHGDMRSGVLSGKSFDQIIFADSIQYFPSLKKILHWGLSMLRPGGEIHIIDTCMYKQGELEGARRRTAAYFYSLGYPEMADFYFHHNMADLRSFDHTLLFMPHTLRSRLFGHNDPYPWIRICNS
jgi:2-polyprenyl-3-methyl-5-hydroxy-6-metoxy-1,4-benzoquinol methylase